MKYYLSSLSKQNAYACDEILICMLWCLVLDCTEAFGHFLQWCVLLFSTEALGIFAMIDTTIMNWGILGIFAMMISTFLLCYPKQAKRSVQTCCVLRRQD